MLEAIQGNGFLNADYSERAESYCIHIQKYRRMQLLKAVLGKCAVKEEHNRRNRKSRSGIDRSYKCHRRKRTENQIAYYTAAHSSRYRKHPNA